MAGALEIDKRGSRQLLLERTGRLSQLGGITHFVHAEGKSKGVSTLRVRTARGLEFWVLPDRGMDIFEASFRGGSLCWHSPTGVVHPAYFSSRGLDWLESFAGGLLCTCGLSTVGAPSDDDGQSLGLHGSISNTPAEHLTWFERWEGDDCIFTISGKVREASVHGANLLLQRTISTTLQSGSITLHDSVENQGVRDSPLMLLYHFNFGFPLLTERSQVFGPSLALEASGSYASRTVADWSTFGLPEFGAEERVYSHQMQPDPEGRVTVVLVSDRDQPDLGVSLSYDGSALPEFTQWKMTGANHFVLGLEPGNCRTQGRAAERKRGTLQTLAPGERREFDLKVTMLDGAEQVAAAIKASGLQ